MATVPALVLSRDEVRLLLRLLGAVRENYVFSNEQYREMELAVYSEPVNGLIAAMQAVAQEEG